MRAMAAPHLSSSAPAAPTVAASGDGELRWYRDCLAELRLTGEQTGDRVSVVELDLPAGATTPLHRQPYDDETIYVVSGALTVHLDGAEQHAATGALVSHTRYSSSPATSLSYNAITRRGSFSGSHRY